MGMLMARQGLGAHAATRPAGGAAWRRCFVGVLYRDAAYLFVYRLGPGTLFCPGPELGSYLVGIFCRGDSIDGVHIWG